MQSTGVCISEDFFLATGATEASVVNRAVRRVASGVQAADDATAAAERPIGICQGSSALGASVVRIGLVAAIIGAAHEPVADGEELSFDNTGALVAASAGDWVVAHWGSDDEVTAGDVTNGHNVRRVFAVPPYQIPET